MKGTYAGCEPVKKPKMAAATHPAIKSRLPMIPLNKMGGVEKRHSGLKTLRVVAASPPPDAERPPSKIWNKRDDRTAGFA